MFRPDDVAGSARTASQIYQLVSEFTIPIAVGLLADWQLGSLPWGMLIGMAIGLMLGIFRIRTILRKLERQDRE